MKSPVRPELTTASVVRRQATPAAVDNSASLQTRPMALIYRGMSVQINWATSEPAIEIVPSDAKLVFEAKVKPNDIGFVSVGQKAFIKLSTYDFSIFGSLSGLVSVVGSDSIPNEKGESYYIVKIELTDSNVTSTGKSLELISGMTAQIDILTGKRSVMSYLSSPLTKTFTTAFTEK